MEVDLRPVPLPQNPYRINLLTMPETIEVQETRSEDELVAVAQTAVSRCNWVVGACAAQWTRKFARGRTDADFGAMVGLSGDQVYQRRRVWETFGDVYGDYPNLKWSHFYVALTWDDAPECLQWAEENEATVAEMKAWRRALRGEDLTAAAEALDEWGLEPVIQVSPANTVQVRDVPAGNSERRREAGASRRVDDRDRSETVSGVARESEQANTAYAPYRADAGNPAPRSESDSAVAVRPRHSTEELIKRMTTTLERMHKALTPDVLDECRSLPDKVLNRFLKAVGELSSRAGHLS